MIDTTTTVNPSAHRTRIWQPGLIGAIAAAAVNLTLFAVSRAADTSFLVRRSSDADPTEVTALHVLLTTVIPFIVGLAIAVAAERRLRQGLRTLQVVGAAIAVVSLAGPLSVEADTTAKLVLATMHVITGGCFVVAVGRARSA
jgi:purine-cytosine permease-like protein